MIFRQLFDRQSCTFTYLLGDAHTREAIIIDPVADQVDRDLNVIEELNLTLTYILETHVHADHVTGAAVLRQYTNAKNALSKAACATCADRALVHGDLIKFGAHTLVVRDTPGHTSGCITYVLQEDSTSLAFTGDTLFVRGCGRTDFQGGCARRLFRSVHDQIFTLPGDTLIYPGHDYRGRLVTTVEEEIAHNPRLNRAVLEDDFVRMMEKLRLDDPKMMDVAIPANISCGVTDVLPQSHVRKVMKSMEPLEIETQHGYRIIDVREHEEFHGASGHLVGAELVPLDTIVEVMSSWRFSERLLLVCRSGARSAQACKLLLDAGFHDVTNLSGGMVRWRQQVDGGITQ